jgi:hypothetical protein
MSQALSRMKARTPILGGRHDTHEEHIFSTWLLPFRAFFYLSPELYLRCRWTSNFDLVCYSFHVFINSILYCPMPLTYTTIADHFYSTRRIDVPLSSFSLLLNIVLQGVLPFGGHYFLFVIAASHTFVKRKIIGMQLHLERQPEVCISCLSIFPNKFGLTRSYLESSRRSR